MLGLQNSVDCSTKPLPLLQESAAESFTCNDPNDSTADFITYSDPNEPAAECIACSSHNEPSA